MTISRFRSLPEKSAYQIPFNVSEANLKLWFHGLPSTNDYAVCKQLFSTIRALADEDLNSEDKFNFLQAIHVHVDTVVKRLENIFADSSFPLSSTENDHVEIIVWCYAELANSYRDCLQTKDEQSEALQAFIIYQALQALSQSLLYMSQVYEQPYTGFWSLCYELYKRAEKQNILDLNVLENEVEVKTINWAFKYILGFYECDTNQFRPREIQAIYLFLEKHVDQAVILSTFNEKQADYYRIFDLKGDRPPAAIVKVSTDKRSSTRFLLVLNLAKCIHQYVENNMRESGTLNSLHRAMFKRVIKNLSHFFKRRKFTRIKENRQKHGIIGIDQLQSYLRKDSEKNIQQEARVTDYDPRIAGLWKVPELDLVPLGEEACNQMQFSHNKDVGIDGQTRKLFQNTQRADLFGNIWDQTAIENAKRQEAVTLGEFEVVDSSIKGYGLQVDEQQKIASKIGDIIGFLSETEDRVEIGIICRISKPAEDRIKFGIDLIGMECKAVYLTVPNATKSKNWALFLPAIKGLSTADSIVFKSGTFAAGEIVNLLLDGKKINCRLQKLLVSTSAISHMELFYPKK